MSEQADWDALLRRVDALARDLERLRRDVLRAMTRAHAQADAVRQRGGGGCHR